MNKHLEEILGTELDLINYSSEERNSPELLLDLFLEEASCDCSSVGIEVIEQYLRFLSCPKNQKYYVSRPSEGIFTRRYILDTLIEQTGSSTSLRNMNLSQFKIEGDDTTRRILVSIIRKVVELYLSSQPSSSIAEINSQTEFLKKKVKYDGDIKCYLIEKIATKLGIY